MLKTTVSTTGFRELEAALADIEKVATRKAVGRKALRAAAEPIAARARELAPDDPATGDPDLHRSIAVSTRQSSSRFGRLNKASEGELEMHIGPARKGGVPAGMMQEMGTIFHPAQPFMRPAWEQEGEDRALTRIKDGLAVAIGKAAKTQERRHRRQAAKSWR